MRLLSSLPLVAALAILPGVASATTIFSDGFQTGTPGLSVMTAGNFSTTGGSNVDLLGPGPGTNFGYLCRPGVAQCVDLGGTNGNPSGQLVSNTTFAAGTYLLSFDLIGSGRGDHESVEVVFGNYDHVFTLNAADLAGGVVTNQLVTVTGSSTLSFLDQQNTSESLILNSASVSNVPEPSSLALLGSGILSGLGFIKRHRKQA